VLICKLALSVKPKAKKEQDYFAVLFAVMSHSLRGLHHHMENAPAAQKWSTDDWATRQLSDKTFGRHGRDDWTSLGDKVLASSTQ